MRKDAIRIREVTLSAVDSYIIVDMLKEVLARKELPDLDRFSRKLMLVVELTMTPEFQTSALDD
ncbi:hypothetical protein FKW77_007977 [Venturia effusa]|uniref:Uncharacterized protein n=1 Tax=Venturia effusa TaxID=50376 RepID=A0A517KZS8_9PEZI|nr:hypothetical protein FKW77_007977 [Venturia effusa]